MLSNKEEDKITAKMLGFAGLTLDEYCIGLVYLNFYTIINEVVKLCIFIEHPTLMLAQQHIQYQLYPQTYRLF